MRGWLAISMMLVAGGCGGTSTCVPGQSAPCVCSDGSGGAQVCRGDGTFDACACGVVGTGGNGGSGGAGGGGGGAGGAGGGGGVSTGVKRLFVSSTAYSPTVAAGICNTVAQAANLSGSWVPWLSSTMPTTSDTIDAINAIKGTGPWVLLDGSEAFANHAQLATAPTTAIAVTEKMTKLSAGDDYVWTGTANGGAYSGADCFHWTETGGSFFATVGHATAIQLWTTASTSYCTESAHVYCFEQ